MTEPIMEESREVMIYVEQALFLGLFEDIKFKYIKDLIKDESEMFEVNIKYLPCDMICHNTIEFELNFETETHTCKKKVEITYNTSSPVALKMCEIEEQNGLYEEEEEEEEEQ
jgi:energy-coupling factor transporter ATP-binding protein EcfA2